MAPGRAAARAMGGGSFLEVLWIFLRLGLTSFGGPIAHLGYFRSEFVERRKWIDDRTYADLVALCQFLPGPASSQVGISLGLTRAGLLGGLAAWLGFTLPSALLMTVFALGIAAFAGEASRDLLNGLKIVAVAVVAQAVWGMATSLCPDRPRVTIAILAAIAILVWPTGIGQVSIIALAGLIGWRRLAAGALAPAPPLQLAVSRRLAVICWVIFAGLLVGLPLARQVVPGHALALFDSFYRSGALVFGGGHVVLPLLRAEVVPTGWITDAQFVAGYGAAQAVPGPLFTFSAYLGAISSVEPNGWPGALIALVGIFLPAWLLVIGALPFWDGLRARPAFQSTLRGINAAVVGLLLAALYDPVWTSAIRTPVDLALALAAFGLLVFWKWPPWLVVILTGLAGAAVALR